MIKPVRTHPSAQDNSVLFCVCVSSILWCSDPPGDPAVPVSTRHDAGTDTVSGSDPSGGNRTRQLRRHKTGHTSCFFHNRVEKKKMNKERWRRAERRRKMKKGGKKKKDEEDGRWKSGEDASIKEIFLFMYTAVLASCTDIVL